MQSRINLSYATLTMAQCSFAIIVAAHWYACIIALHASLLPSPNESWLGADFYGFCDAPTVGEASAFTTSGAEGELTASALPGCEAEKVLTVGAWYLASLAWSIMILTGTGGTDYYPSSSSESETLIVMLLVIVGALLWTRVLATFCDVATNSRPGLTHFHQQLDGLNEFIATNRLPKEMGQRLREYLHQMKSAMLQDHAAKTIPNLSIALQIEVVLHCHRHWLDAIWFLRGMDELVLVRLAMSMSTRVLAPNEVAPLRCMYVLTKGCVLYGGRVLSKGMTWGDDIILENEKNFLPFLARAMSYADAQVWHRLLTPCLIPLTFPPAHRVSLCASSPRRHAVPLILVTHLWVIAGDRALRAPRASQRLPRVLEDHAPRLSLPSSAPPPHPHGARGESSVRPRGQGAAGLGGAGAPGGESGHSSAGAVGADGRGHGSIVIARLEDARIRLSSACARFQRGGRRRGLAVEGRHGTAAGHE